MSSSTEQKLMARLHGQTVEEKIEVVARRENPRVFEIRLLRWGRGIGWYVQKTIPLDAVQAKTLMRALRSTVLMSAKRTGKGNVIRFPVCKPK